MEKHLISTSKKSNTCEDQLKSKKKLIVNFFKKSQLARAKFYFLKNLKSPTCENEL
jgi:hypothetical protein